MNIFSFDTSCKNDLSNYIIRPAKINDVTIMVGLSYQKRKSYEKAQALFWKYATGAEEIQTNWFKDLLSRDDHIILVSEGKSKVNGFIMGRLMKAPEVYDPGGLTLMVDDFCVEEPKLWMSVGKELLKKAREIAKTKGASQLLVVSGHLNAPKRAFLKQQGLEVASDWYVGEI